MNGNDGKVCRMMAAVVFTVLLIGSLVGFVFATKKDVMLALGVLLGGGALSCGAFYGLNALAEAGQQKSTETKEDKKTRKLNKLLDDLCDN